MKEMTAKTQTWIRKGVLAALIVAAAALWWTEGRQVPSAKILPTPAPTVKKTERIKRETAYEQDVAALQKILESGAADAATQEMAAAELQRSCGIRVCSVVTRDDIIRAMENGVIGGVEHLAAMNEYRRSYGGM